MISMLKDAPQATQDWQYSSVQTFFSTCNWEDQQPTSQTVATLEQAMAIAPFTELSFDLKVQQFFASVNWEGSEIPAISSTPIMTFDEPSDEFTLTNFSDLF